ncbi:MAG: superoxide dismutase family protein [Bdellovibrionaceae bacterium]|nr:superoxide dismutase family protein [Pseudobdellovibrionaceae bacterium]
MTALSMSRKTALLLSALTLAACASTNNGADGSTASTAATQTAPLAEQAQTTLQAAPGQKVAGTVQFQQTSEGVKVTGEFAGFAPKSKHGIHIHENGDCSDPKFSSAGAHFNPTQAPHGAPGAHEKHAGDLGNLTADSKGKAKLDLTLPNTKLGDNATGFIGRAIIVHMKADDLKSQPSGNSGDRIACGTITTTK